MASRFSDRRLNLYSDLDADVIARVATAECDDANSDNLSTA